MVLKLWLARDLAPLIGVSKPHWGYPCLSKAALLICLKIWESDRQGPEIFHPPKQDNKNSSIKLRKVLFQLSQPAKYDFNIREKFREAGSKIKGGKIHLPRKNPWLEKTRRKWPMPSSLIVLRRYARPQRQSNRIRRRKKNDQNNNSKILISNRKIIQFIPQKVWISNVPEQEFDNLIVRVTRRLRAKWHYII